MAMVRPSLILHMDISESAYSEDVADDIKRSYSYVAPSIVAARKDDGKRPENILRFAAKLRRPYWSKADKESEELWRGVMPKWLGNMFYKVSSTMVAYNKVRCDKNEGELVFDWIEVAFEPHATIVLRLGPDSSIPRDAVDLIEQARTLLNDGAFEKEVACVRIPSRASFESQRRAAIDALVAEKREGVEENPAVGDEGQSEELLVPTHPVFDIDYGTWEVEFADGSVLELSPSMASFE